MNIRRPAVVKAMMKSGALILALWIGAAQTVSATDCSCLVCEGRETCGGCSKPPAPSDPSPECCGGEAEPAPAKGPCVHLDPSEDVVLDDSSVPAILFQGDLIVPVGGIPTWDLPDVRVPDVGIPRPAREGPLNLLNSVLLI